MKQIGLPQLYAYPIRCRGHCVDLIRIAVDFTKNISDASVMSLLFMSESFPPIISMYVCLSAIYVSSRFSCFFQIREI